VILTISILVFDFRATGGNDFSNRNIESSINSTQLFNPKHNLKDNVAGIRSSYIKRHITCNWCNKYYAIAMANCDSLEAFSSSKRS
jgi:hypothetical protein